MIPPEPTPPVAEDDFPEFAEPPRHRPPPERPRESGRAAKPAAGEAADARRSGSGAQASSQANSQGEVDEVIARLRREREQGKR